MTQPIAPVIWALSAGHAGARAQAEGFAEQLALLSGGTMKHFSVRLPPPAKLLPPIAARYFARINADFSTPPDIAVGCGINGQSAILSLKKKYNAYAVYIQRPTGNATHFDAIIAPRHDYRDIKIPTNLIPTFGAVGKISPDLLTERRALAQQRFAPYKRSEQQPLIAVLVGGNNRAYHIDDVALIKQLDRIATQTNAILLITPSRRTNSHLIHRLHQHFSRQHYCWSGSNDNPYLDILSAADGYCVTADSVNMISEASASGRAVYALPLTVHNQRAAQKFAAFHDALITRGNLRLYKDNWTFFDSKPLDETFEAAQALWQRHQSRYQ